MAGGLGLRHRETHVREQAALAALADVPLGLLVRLGRSRSDDVEADLLCETLELSCPHTAILHPAPSARKARLGRARAGAGEMHADTIGR